MTYAANELSRAAAEKAMKYAASKGFSGCDPYDGLMSPVARLLPSRLTRQIWVQLLKRSGEGARNVAGIPAVRMSKSLALFSMSAFALGDHGRANDLADTLLDVAGGGPWGYEFDVQTRWAHYPAGSPNVIATAFAVRALDLLGRADEVSEEALLWLLSLRQPSGYFAYTPMSDRLIHNGNLLAVESILRLGGAQADVSVAIEVTTRAQRPDGSWPYGAGTDLAWVDNFHTAYVLDSLRYIRSRSLVDSEVIDRGTDYWLEELFLETGEPLYYATSKSPSKDVHNVATAVSTLAALVSEGERIGERRNALKVLLGFQGADGAFRNKANGPVFMRWNQAHATYALTRWINQ
ncbi:prenyltransferase/squalene oxidase repeat-containing protein [Arthrobacter sp. ISL-72]|uniref:prenyltransferase/squalene oxidase repeat-containing protein n=1 Tax=Arthrobacter sp. ISL-72 TaxID=2819114 RepID=UPI001BEC0D83|nr:prenyltransferase/squalene oxidase repeat-containing protein [Arthrobacter sp. ISL-72]MBT2596622.1 terpene cyclase/mutase family protein [Arthrobacter sp. ISL-72]